MTTLRVANNNINDHYNDNDHYAFDSSADLSGEAGELHNHAGVAPAARDLGYFAAQAMTRMYTRTGSIATARPWVVTIRDEYRSHRKGGDVGFMAYVARTIQEVLYYRLRRARHDADRLIDAWLTDCEGALIVAEQNMP